MKSLKKIIQILSISTLLAHLVAFKAIAAHDPEVSQAFASFIETMHASVQTVNKSSSICIYGSDDISLRMQSQNKLVVILDVNTASKKNYYGECRIIYVAKDSEKFVKSFIETLNRSGALTVAAFDSFVNDGGMVFIDLGRRDFELTVNSQAFKKSGVKLDSAITALIINNKSRQ